MVIYHLKTYLAKNVQACNTWIAVRRTDLRAIHRSPEDIMKSPAILLFLAVLATASPVAAPVAASARAVSEASAVSVFINGLGRIESSAWCIWEATASGGTAPYTYEWSTNGGGGSALEERWGGHFPVSGTLTVDVTDALGATGTWTMSVTSVSGGPWCP